MPQDRSSNATKGFWALAVLVVLCIILAVCLRTGASAKQTPPESSSSKQPYSVGYQIGPHYLGSSTWEGTPYAITPMTAGEVPCPAPYGRKSRFTPFAPPDEGPRGTTDPPELIYTPPITSDLRGSHPNWWRPDGGTYGLPPASERPDFWAGDATLHTYLARDPIPQLCESGEVASDQRRMTDAEWVDQWRQYGGALGWNMSPYY